MHTPGYDRRYFPGEGVTDEKNIIRVAGTVMSGQLPFKGRYLVQPHAVGELGTGNWCTHQ
jgi:hypothetical protein